MTRLLTHSSGGELEISSYSKQVCVRVCLTVGMMWQDRGCVRDMNEALPARGLTSRELTSDLPMTNLRHV